MDLYVILSLTFFYSIACYFCFNLPLDRGDICLKELVSIFTVDFVVLVFEFII